MCSGWSNLMSTCLDRHFYGYIGVRFSGSFRYVFKIYFSGYKRIKLTLTKIILVPAQTKNEQNIKNQDLGSWWSLRLIVAGKFFLSCLHREAVISIHNPWAKDIPFIIIDLPFMLPVCVWVHACMCVCMCVCACLYFCACVCICLTPPIYFRLGGALYRWMLVFTYSGKNNVKGHIRRMAVGHRF